MVGGGNKRLPCSHIFHTACLRSWFQRQQTCPTCRMDVLRQPAAAAAAAAANQGAAPPPAAGQAAPQAPPNVPGQAFPQLLPPPPPVPPEGLEALSAEELSAMEGQEREQIAARIRVLRNIQTLLDAAVLQLQQYSAVVASAGAPSAASSAPSSVDLSASGSKEGAASAAVRLRQSDDDPNAEVRRRRLQRFSQGAMPNGVSSPDTATESNGTNDDSRHPH
ncbi:hypothetical protein HPB52_000655 [Rhipicephalus sanguineus]|uniref:RING-type domain-containing protein n=1 Tax=Rhipicephalus sanguineus TaxID=34632 RepID=A0A9D4T3H6_RHISA|nr:hypothetical protein HPB52_000655 [Rhipicephalus sanguineus]